MLQTFRQIAAFERPVHVLLANMLVNNIAFYMLDGAGHPYDPYGFAAFDRQATALRGGADVGGPPPDGSGARKRKGRAARAFMHRI